MSRIVWPSEPGHLEGQPQPGKRVPANETPQLELLYRDIKIQMEELHEIRPYKAAVIEIKKFIDCCHYSEELHEVLRILERHNIK